MSLIDSSALATLRRALSPSASVHLPGEPGYSVKRWALNAEQPATIVGHPACAEDVVHMLAFAQGKAPYDMQSALPLAVKCGGHEYLTSSRAGGMIVDLNPNMHNVCVDANAMLAYVGGGSLLEDVNATTLPQGLACVTGVCMSVGVGGSTLGGGFGWLTGQHGLAIDNLVSATVVTSSGEILTASETTNSDLFWAIRGGGGNFGVVTEFVMRLHEQKTDMYSSTLTFTPSMLENLVPELNAWLAERESNENAHLMFTLGASGQLEVVLQLAYNGDSVIGAKKFERFVKLGPTENSSGAMPLYMLNHQQDTYTVPGTNRLLHGNFIPSTPSGIPSMLLVEMFDAWARFTVENPAAVESAMVLELYHTDKWASVPASATAYANRNPTYNVAYIVTWSDESFSPSAKDETFALDQNITRIRTAHFPHQGGAAYTNYLHSSSKFTPQQFGENAARLEQIKAKYDSAGVFGKWFVATKKEEAVTRAIEPVELVSDEKSLDEFYEYVIISNKLEPSGIMTTRPRPFMQVDVFTSSDAFSGNPVAVVLDSQGLSSEMMKKADYRLRIFTPSGELPFAGHPTLGSCRAWLESGNKPKNGGEVTQECGIGLVTMKSDPASGRLSFAAPDFVREGDVSPEDLKTLCDSMGIASDDVLASRWIDNDPGWAGLILKSAEDVLAIKTDSIHKAKEFNWGIIGAFEKGQNLLQRGLQGETVSEGHDIDDSPRFEVRAFAPKENVLEDPVCGSLNAGVAKWLIDAGLAPQAYVASQGTCLGREGRIYVSANSERGGRGGKIWVGGNTRVCINGSVP